MLQKSPILSSEGRSRRNFLTEKIRANEVG